MYMYMYMYECRFIYFFVIQCNYRLVILLSHFILAVTILQLILMDPKSTTYIFQVSNSYGCWHNSLCCLECKSLVNCLLTDLVQSNPSLFQKECVDAVRLLVAEGGEGVGGESEGIGSKMSPVFLKWDALISFLECWVLGLNQNETLLKV